jgi:hypothetical protein
VLRIPQWHGRLPSPTLLTALAVLTVSCSAATDGPPERVAQLQSAILNGTSVPSGTATAMGDIAITFHHPSDPGCTSGFNCGCSGVLLRNDYVITARHCVTVDGSVGGSIDYTVGDYKLAMDSQSVGAFEVIDLTGGSSDFAFIGVTPFFQTGPNGNQAEDWLRPVYSGTDASLVGTTLTCQGYGSTSCSGPAGTLTTANIAPVVATTSLLTFSPNTSGQIQYSGDSGSTCFTSGGAMTFIASNNLGCGTAGSGAGPQAILPVVNSLFETYRPGATIATSTSSNVSFDSMTLNGAGANFGANASVFITPNWNPPGQPGAYLNHNLGVWWNGSSWLVFNQDLAAMPTGVSFNVSVSPSLYYVAGTQGAFASGDSMFLPEFANENQILIVTQNWNPPGGGAVYNNHPIGVWWAGSSWAVFNEDGAAMPAGVAFNIAVTSNTAAATYIHYASSSNVNADSTFLDNPNLNGQPAAKVLVTPNWNPPGGVPTYLPHPIGVWYDGSNWAIFNEDLAAMPTTAAFNVTILP